MSDPIRVIGGIEYVIKDYHDQEMMDKDARIANLEERIKGYEDSPNRLINILDMELELTQLRDQLKSARDNALEEAANKSETFPQWMNESESNKDRKFCEEIATAIRSLKTKGD
jgi:hypothetical protein